MQDLFSPDRIASTDPHGVRETYDRWPSMARDGFNIGVELPSKKLKKAYVLGMGGSAAGGDIIAGWLSDRSGVQLAVFKGQLPVGDLGDAIAIACSASGQTEETIQMLRTAVERRATSITISGGGKLKEVSKELGVPHIDMPKFLAPRYGFPFIFYSTLAIVNRGLGLECEQEAEESFDALESEGKEINVSVPQSGNAAKQLAVELYQMIPTIYATRVARGVGIRFKNILNENAKMHSLFDGIPDAFHNDIEAWEGGSPGFVPIFLRHSLESPRDRRRVNAMIDVLSQSGPSVVQVSGRGSASLAQLVSMVFRLDLTSYYAAVALGRDPFPTRFMDRLKRMTSAT